MNEKTHDHSPYDEFDEDQFKTELVQLVNHAQRAGVMLEGGYDVRTLEREQPDYTVEITEITKRPLAK